MDRRRFIKTGGAITSLAALSPAASMAQNNFLPPENIPASLVKSIRARIKPITAQERAERRVAAQKLMAVNNIDCIFMEGGTSLNYFTGAGWGRSERLFGMLLPQKGEAVFISPKFEESRAKEQTGNARIYTWEENESPYELIKQMLKEQNLLNGSMGIEETTRYFVTEGIQKTIPSLQIGSATPITAGCRAIKSEHEVELMQIANDIAKEVFMAAVKKLKVGMTEKEYGRIITQLFAEFGCEGGALVLFGEASAHPHGLVKEVKLKEGDIVLMDGGCSVEGYESDITRTTVFGKPTQKMNDIFTIVRNAQIAGLLEAKPGIAAELADAAARKVIVDAGYGPDYKYFTHRLGHGIGMDGHEWYYLVGGNKRLMEPGNMFSNEPGIYIPGEFGIRIEDEMLITPSGSRLLLPPPLSLEKMF